MTQPLLQFTDHDDVVFAKAPLTLVLCQVRFPPVFSLLEEAGVAGFQESLRRSYPVTAVDKKVEFRVDAKRGESPQVKQNAPVWRLRTEDEQWTVSAAVDFIALETPRYPHWQEFRDRLEFVLAATDRTIAPALSTRIGLRKVNKLRHPEVQKPRDWATFLRPEILALSAADLPGKLKSSVSQMNIGDDRDGMLTIRFGPDPEELSAFRLDLDYWTEEKAQVAPSADFVDRLESYSNSITSFFHWSLLENMYRHLDPHPRA